MASIYSILRVWLSLKTAYVTQIAAFLSVPLIMAFISLQFLMGSVSLFVGDISELIEGCSASIFLFYLLVIIGLIIMRFTHKEEPRFYKVSSVSFFPLSILSSFVLPLLIHMSWSLFLYTTQSRFYISFTSGMVHLSCGNLHGTGLPIPCLPSPPPSAPPLPHGILHHPHWCTSLPFLCHGNTMETKA